MAGIEREVTRRVAGGEVRSAFPVASRGVTTAPTFMEADRSGNRRRVRENAGSEDGVRFSRSFRGVTTAPTDDGAVRNGNRRRVRENAEGWVKCAFPVASAVSPPRLRKAVPAPEVRPDRIAIAGRFPAVMTKEPATSHLVGRFHTVGSSHYP